jgi:hypothetical protein
VLDVRDFHDGEYKDVTPCSLVKNVARYRRVTVSTYPVVGGSFSETLVNLYKAARCRMAEDSDLVFERVDRLTL